MSGTAGAAGNGVVEIFTDGACSGNPGPGGWGALLRYGEHERELTGSANPTTNNRMEMLAAISALEALKRPSRVHIHTDSQYLRDGITRWVSQWKARLPDKSSCSIAPKLKMSLRVSVLSPRTCSGDM